MIIKDLFVGANSYFNAARVIKKHKLWPFMAVPGFLSICYVLILIVLGSVYFDNVSAYINESWIPGFMQGNAMQVVVNVILWLFLLVIGFVSYKEVVLIFFSPFLGYLSEKVESLVYGHESPPFKLKDLVTDIIRGLILSFRNLFAMLLFTFLALLVAFIPLIGTVVSPVLIILIQSYYGGVGLVDFTLERKRYTVKDSIAFSRKNRGRITGVGIGFVLILMVPVLGWFAAPGYGTVAATLSILEKMKEEETALPKNSELQV